MCYNKNATGDVKMYNIKEIENYLCNYAYEKIIENSHPFGVNFSTQDVYGNKVRSLNFADLNNVVEKWYKLRPYYTTIEIEYIETDLEKIKNKMIRAVRKETSKMFSGIDKFKEPFRFTCYQLADWQWLKNDDGAILRENFKDGSLIYSATMVKYAVVLDYNGDPLDPNIKEEQ